jgi:UDP-glucose 4-epimerase
MTESHPQLPINPYGWSKLLAEQALRDYGAAYGLQSVSLRYFNAAGCDPAGALGERHEPETHIIPLALLEARRVLQGGDPRETRLVVHGDDYDTHDGTCMRDYIHVTDLAAAHLAAAQRLLAGKVTAMEAYNLGNGTGFSVREVIESCRRVTGADVRYSVGPRRQGDPAHLVGSAARAHEVLGWEPLFPRLDDIVATAWKWFGRA